MPLQAGLAAPHNASTLRVSSARLRAVRCMVASAVGNALVPPPEDGCTRLRDDRTAGTHLLLVVVAATATPARAQDPGVEIALVITSTTVNRQTNTVSVTGSVQCSASSANSVFVIVTQQIGGSAPVHGYDDITLQCGPTATTFTLTAAADQGTFRPGPAHLVASSLSYGCVDLGCFPLGEEARIDTTVRLHPAR